MGLTASGRSIMDCIRTVFVWFLEIGWLWARGLNVGPRKFNFFEVCFWTEKLGFLLITVGTFVYFGVIQTGLEGTKSKAKSLSKAESDLSNATSAGPMSIGKLAGLSLKVSNEENISSSEEEELEAKESEVRRKEKVATLSNVSAYLNRTNYNSIV